jgi:hypothetical protein
MANDKFGEVHYDFGDAWYHTVKVKKLFDD